jgi:predicted nucleic acid-binding protein
MRIYIDNCCFNRPYDDQTQLRIELETKAKLLVQHKIMNGTLELVISSMSRYENNKNPYDERKSAIGGFFKYAAEEVKSSPTVRADAKNLENKGLKTKDATHLAFAINAKCHHFLTTDDKVLKLKEDRITIMNPVEFINILEDEENDD